MQLWNTVFAVALLLSPPKHDDKMKKSGQSCIHKEVTSYKIHTLERWPDNNFET